MPNSRARYHDSCVRARRVVLWTMNFWGHYSFNLCLIGVSLTQGLPLFPLFTSWIRACKHENRVLHNSRFGHAETRPHTPPPSFLVF